MNYRKIPAKWRMILGVFFGAAIAAYLQWGSGSFVGSFMLGFLGTLAIVFLLTGLYDLIQNNKNKN